MDTYTGQILGPDPGSELFLTHTNAIERQIRKGKKRKKRRKALKKLEKKLRALEQEQMRVAEIEKELRTMRKRKKGRKRKHKKETKKNTRAMEQERQRQDLRWQDAMTTARVLFQLLGSPAVSVNWPQSQSQVIELPAPRN